MISLKEFNKISLNLYKDEMSYADWEENTELREAFDRADKLGYSKQEFVEAWYNDRPTFNSFLEKTEKPKTLTGNFSFKENMTQETYEEREYGPAEESEIEVYNRIYKFIDDNCDNNVCNKETFGREYSSLKDVVDYLGELIKDSAFSGNTREEAKKIKNAADSYLN